MVRFAVGAVAVLAFACGAARADEFMGAIKKIEDGKITIATKFDRDTKKFTEEKTYTLAPGVKILSATFNREEKKIEVGEKLQGGLKNERLQNIGERGVRAQIITNADGQVTEIRVLPARKPQQ
jgi:hypothetical protein